MVQKEIKETLEELDWEVFILLLTITENIDISIFQLHSLYFYDDILHLKNSFSIGLTGLKGDTGIVGEPGLPGPVIEIKGEK